MDGLRDEEIDSLLREAEERIQGSAKKPCVLPDPMIYPTDSISRERPSRHAGNSQDLHIRKTAKSSGTQPKRHKVSDAGAKWFNMPKAEVTAELKRHWKIIRMRGILDPKNRKKAVKAQLPEYAQLGDVIEDGDSTRSARPKGTVLDELIEVEKAKKQFRAKYRTIQDQRASGGKKFYKTLVARRKGRNKKK